MRKLALFIFGTLALILGIPAIAWLSWAIDWIVTGVDEHNIWATERLLFALIGWFSIFTFFQIKSDKDWPNKNNSESSKLSR